MHWIAEAEIQTGKLRGEWFYYWLDNPLQTWARVKAAMQRKELLRVQLSEDERSPRYAGYLFSLSGNRFKLVKHGKPPRTFSYAELMGLCLGARLWVDTLHEMPHYYQKFQLL